VHKRRLARKSFDHGAQQYFDPESRLGLENKSSIQRFVLSARPPWRRVQSLWLRLTSAAGFAREKSQPRNGAGEIFMTAAAEIARETVSAAKGFEHETRNLRRFARK